MRKVFYFILFLVGFTWVGFLYCDVFQEFFGKKPVPRFFPPPLSQSEGAGGQTVIVPRVFRWPSDSDIESGKIQLSDRDFEEFKKNLYQVFQPQWIDMEKTKNNMISLRKLISNRIPPEGIEIWSRYEIEGYSFVIYYSDTPCLDIGIKKNESGQNFLEAGLDPLSPKAFEQIIDKFLVRENVFPKDVNALTSNNPYKYWERSKRVIDSRFFSSKKLGEGNYYWSDGEIIWVEFFTLPSSRKFGYKVLNQ